MGPTFILTPRSGVPHRVWRAAPNRMRLSLAQRRNEEPRSRAGRSLANRIKAGAAAEIMVENMGEIAVEIGAGTAASSVSSEGLGRYREFGSRVTAIAAARLAWQSWDNHSL